LFVKGLIYGLIASFANFALSYINLNWFKGKAPGSAIALYLISFLARFAVIGIFVYLFLKYRWGSVLGLMVGFTVALFFFTIWRIYSGNTRSSKL
jgi:hypothetical protein